MTQVELGWIAGIIDGEGCISVKGRGNRGNRVTHSSLSVTVVSVDKIIVKKLKQIIGGNYIFKKHVQENRKDFYRWEITCKSAWQMLEQIVSFLTCKKERAKIAIELGKRTSNRTGYKVCHFRKGYKDLNGSGISGEELEYRTQLMEKLKGLNRRGKGLGNGERESDRVRYGKL